MSGLPITPPLRRQVRKQEEIPEILRAKNRRQLAKTIIAENKAATAANPLLSLDTRSWGYFLRGVASASEKATSA